MTANEKKKYQGLEKERWDEGKKNFKLGTGWKSISSTCFRFLLITLCASRSLHSTSAFIQSVFIKDLLYARPVWGARNEVCVFEWNFMFFFEQLWSYGFLSVRMCMVCLCVYFCVSSQLHMYMTVIVFLLLSSEDFLSFAVFTKSGAYLFDFYTWKLGGMIINFF